MRFQYEKSAAFILRLMDPIIEMFSKVSATGDSSNLRGGRVHFISRPTPYPTPLQPPQVTTQGTSSQQLSVVEGQLTWMIYIVGAVIKGRLSSSSAESQVSCDPHSRLV